MDPKQFAWMRALVSTLPSGFGMYKFAAILALNGHPAEAQKWLLRILLVTPPPQSELIQAEWANQSRIHSQIAAIPWPTLPK